MTRRRLYLEAMEQILPGVKKFVLSDQGVLPFLPLDGSTSQSGTAPTGWLGGRSAMKFLAVLVVLIIAGLIVIPQTFFTVDETQLAIVTRFGAYQRTHAQPGLYVKTPFVESVTKFDSRLLRVDAPTASLLTRDKKNLVIDSYARYKIVDPLLFFQSLRSELQAEARVGDIVASRLRREVALDLQEEIISETREQVMGRVTEASNRDEIELEILLDLPGQIDNPEVTIEVTEIREPDEDPARGRPATPEEFAALKRDPGQARGIRCQILPSGQQHLGDRHHRRANQARRLPARRGHLGLLTHGGRKGTNSERVARHRSRAGRQDKGRRG